MSDKYIPLGRDFELQMRAECPEYREMRLRIANEWRLMRRTYGSQLARGHWRGLIDARKLTVRMIPARMLRDADGN